MERKKFQSWAKPAENSIKKIKKKKPNGPTRHTRDNEC